MTKAWTPSDSGLPAGFDPFAHPLLFKRVACPICKDGIVRAERERPGVVTLYCDGCDRFHVYLHKLEDGTVSEIDAFKPLDQDQAKPGRKPETMHRHGPTRCLAKRCQLIAREGGLCETHFAGWCADGRPADREAWAAAQIDLDKGRRAPATAPTSTEPLADPAGGGFVDDPSTLSPTVEPPPAVVPATPQDQETTMKEVQCRAPGCGVTFSARSDNCGLCKRHKSKLRYAGFTTKQVDQWIETLEADGSQPAAGKASRKATATGATVDAQKALPVAQQPASHVQDVSTIKLPEGTSEICVLTLKRFVTIVTNSGQVLFQIPPTA